jgi:hypothetical protein
MLPPKTKGSTLITLVTVAAEDAVAGEKEEVIGVPTTEPILEPIMEPIM